MYKRLLALVLMLCLLPALPVRAEDAFFAYFQDARWLRTEP